MGGHLLWKPLISQLSPDWQFRRCAQDWMIRQEYNIQIICFTKGKMLRIRCGTYNYKPSVIQKSSGLKVYSVIAYKNNLIEKGFPMVFVYKEV